MACQPQAHHITSLSLNGDGWIVGNAVAEEQEGNGGGQQQQQLMEILLPSCQRLLKYAKLDPSCDSLFHAGTGGIDNNAPVDVTPIEELKHCPNLSNNVLKVIADIRRLGAPSERDQRRNEREGGGGDDVTNTNDENNRRRGRGGGRSRNGKVARLEEQRRLRQQQEQQKMEQSKQKKELDEEKKGALEEEKNKENEVVDDDGEGFILIGENNDETPEQGKTSLPWLDVPVEKRLPAVFNSLRVLITILRPILDHPRHKDATLHMKKGPSISGKGKNHRIYLLSKHVYARVSTGLFNELKREYARLLDETQPGLSGAMSKLNSNGQYELSPKDWVASLFDHQELMNQDLVAKKCLEIPNLNAEVASKLHNALMDRFENEHDEMQYMLQRSISHLQETLTSTISRRFNGARLTVYGSCLSNLALEGSHDVDVSIYIPELAGIKKSFDSGQMSAEQYEKKMRRIIFQVRDSLLYCRSERFFDLFAVTRARVPVVKGAMHARNPYTQDGSLAFDLCFLNEIAVVNSSLLREYSLFGSHVRILMLSIKSFAKANNLGSAADGTLSSYTWLNMVVFYLQCIGMLPVLQCPELMQQHGFKPNPKNPWHCVNGLDTYYLTNDIVKKKNIWSSLCDASDIKASTLLCGFFKFYSSVFPAQTVAASIRMGNISLQKTSFHQTSRLWRICIEDPFETCTSHCPHDLGCHAKEDGQSHINDNLLRAAKEMEELMQEDMASDDTISIFLSKFLGPMHTPNNHGKSKKGLANKEQVAPQNNGHQKGKSHYQAANRQNHNSGRGHGRKTSHKKQENNHGKASNNKNHNAISTYMSAKSQMKGGRGNKGGSGAGKHGDPVYTQKKDSHKGKNTQNSNGHADGNSTQSNKKITQAENPAANKEFMKKQKKRLVEIAEEKKRKSGSKQKNNQNQKDAATGEKTNFQL